MGCPLVFFDANDILSVDEMWTVSIFGSIMHRYKTAEETVAYDNYLVDSEFEELPPGWEKHTDGGQIYYSNEETGETSWERPKLRTAANVAVLASKWKTKAFGKSKKKTSKRLSKRPEKTENAEKSRVKSYRASVQRGQLQAYNPAMPVIGDGPKEWYYLDPETNDTQGPYPGESMQHWRSGMDEPFLTDDMLVCLDGEAAWQKVSTVSSFK